MWQHNAACAVTAAVAILSALPLYSYYSGVEKHQWREAISEIESNAGSGDYVLVFPHFEAVTARYYLERGDLELVPVKDRFPSYPGMLTHDVWFVMQAHPASRLNTKAGLTQEYDFISESRYHRLDLFRLRKKSE